MNKNSFEMVYWFHSMIFLTNFRKRQFLNMTELLTPTIGISSLILADMNTLNGNGSL